MKKRGVSPVIATILLIVIVIILAVIIFLWAKGFVQEKVEKFDRPIERSCSDVNFDVSISGKRLSINNQGNVPIYKLSIQKKEGGTVTTEEPVVNLGKGESRSDIDLEESLYASYELNVIPVLLGKSGNQEKEYTCDERYGIDVEATQ